MTLQPAFNDLPDPINTESRSRRGRPPHAGWRWPDRLLTQRSSSRVDATGQPMRNFLDDPHVAVGIVEGDV
jgi:hypothetical protein